MKPIKLLNLIIESLNSAKSRFLNNPKFKDKLNTNTFEEFLKVDTSSTKKYIEKMCEIFVNDFATKEEIIDVFTKAIPKIEKKLVNFDISKLKTLKDYEDFRDNIAFAEILNNKQKRKVVVEKGSEKVYEDDRFTILRVDTRDAMKRIGLDTTWCLTVKDDKENRFYTYPYVYETSYVIFDNNYPEKHSLSKINVQVKKDESFGEIRTADQFWEGIKNEDVPVKYLKDLGLKLSLFKWTDNKLNYFKENHLFTFRDGLTFDTLKKKFPWVLKDDVKLEPPVLGIKGDKLVWYSGDWVEGTWEDGIWKDGGFFRGNVWLDGIFENGYFMGTWKGGEWKANITKFKGTWENKNEKAPLNIESFEDGLTYEILKKKFPWLFKDDVEIEKAILGIKEDKLVWYDGRWNEGTWEDGIWEDGYFGDKGIWKDGTFEDGEFFGRWRGGKWLSEPYYFGGIWEDSNNPRPNLFSQLKDGLTYEIVKKKFPWLFKDDVNIYYVELGKKGDKLVWYSGDWRGGTWEDGLWKYGRFMKGTWLNGTFEDGIFHNNGIWKGGEWKADPDNFNGKWEDPNNPDPRFV